MNTLFLRPAFLAAFLLLILPVSKAQPFLVNPANAPLSFSAMQRQFHDWSAWHRLDREKNWKYYKRWEAEMLLHTDGHGEPVAPELLAREHLRVHTARQQAGGLQPVELYRTGARRLLECERRHVPHYRDARPVIGM